MILRFRWISGILELSNVIAGFRHYQSWKLKFETNLMQNLVRLSHKFHCHQIWNIVSSLGRCAMQKYNNTKYKKAMSTLQLPEDSSIMIPNVSLSLTCLTLKSPIKNYFKETSFWFLRLFSWNRSAEETNRNKSCFWKVMDVAGGIVICSICICCWVTLIFCICICCWMTLQFCIYICCWMTLHFCICYWMTLHYVVKIMRNTICRFWATPDLK